MQNSDAASCTAQHKQKNNMKQQKSIHIKMLLKKKKSWLMYFFSVLKHLLQLLRRLLEHCFAVKLAMNRVSDSNRV